MRRRGAAGTPLEEAGLSPRARNALWRADIACIEEAGELELIALTA
jgi:hypothetical protein